MQLNESLGDEDGISVASSNEQEEDSLGGSDLGVIVDVEESSVQSEVSPSDSVDDQRIDTAVETVGISERDMSNVGDSASQARRYKREIKPPKRFDEYVMMQTNAEPEWLQRARYIESLARNGVLDDMPENVSNALLSLIATGK